jgi:hypothetical protein
MGLVDGIMHATSRESRRGTADVDDNHSRHGDCRRLLRDRRVDPGGLDCLERDAHRARREARPVRAVRRFIPISTLPPVTPDMAANVDWRKVEGMLGRHVAHPNDSPLDIPALQVLVNIKEQITGC